MTVCDFLIVGAGIAGASAAFELAGLGRVVLIEREEQPAYHSTGRSAALYTQTYGHPIIRALTTGSYDFYARATDGFADTPVLTPRGVVLIGRADQTDRLDAAFRDGHRLVPAVERLDAAETLRRAPMLRPEYVAGAVWEPDAMDLDVHAILQGYIRGLRARGGRIVTNADLHRLERRDRLWIAETRAGRFSAPWIINAAGAWADRVAEMAGLRPIGLVPKRRTAILFDPDPAVPPDRIAGWPMVIDIDEQFYFKPDAGRVLGSPADETPVEPCDVQPEELDVAIAIDRIETAAAFRIKRLTHRWAGLRSFAPDKITVVGADPEADGFFWLAGQGGYGIQTAPAMARTAASLLMGNGIPADLAELGVRAPALAPDRLRAPSTRRRIS